MASAKEEANELLRLNRRLSDVATDYLRWGEWTPIAAAMLLSGIRPTSRWIDLPELENREDSQPISHRDLFLRLQATMETPERGLDDVRVMPTSIRFENARNILELWDQVCTVLEDYPIDLPPKGFTGWLLVRRSQGNVVLLEPKWLDLFANQFPRKDGDQSILSRKFLGQLESLHDAENHRNAKHRFASEIGAVQRYLYAENKSPWDVDEVLSRLSAMIHAGDINNTEWTGYDGERLQYKRFGEKGEILRDSLARQLRRLKEKRKKHDESRREAHRLIWDEHGLPEIKPVEVDSKTVGRFSDYEEMLQLAHALISETSLHVRRLASLQPDELGWTLPMAIPVGIMVRLSKLLASIAALSQLKLTEIISVLVPLALETAADIIYLIEHCDQTILASYMDDSTPNQQPLDKRWSTLDFEEKAQAIGWGDIHAPIEDALLSLHGSWRDSKKYHLTAIEGERFRVKTGWSEPSPRPIILTCLRAVEAASTFASFFEGPVADKLRTGLQDLEARLQRADKGFETFLYAHW